MVVVGGQAEALAAFEEAYNDVFHLQLDCHRHAQPHKSRKDGVIRWDMIEMWPMQVQCLIYTSTLGVQFFKVLICIFHEVRLFCCRYSAVGSTSLHYDCNGTELQGLLDVQTSSLGTKAVAVSRNHCNILD